MFKLTELENSRMKTYNDTQYVDLRNLGVN